MIWLISASLIWAFSFGLIKGLITDVDPFVLGVLRTGIAALFFAPVFFAQFLLPLVKRKPITPIPLKINAHAAICGFLQIGLMYGPYLLSFQYLKAHEVALYTMTTPLIMGFLVSLKSRKNSGRVLVAALLATAGGIIAASGKMNSVEMQIGVALVQLSNLFFASGILLWTNWLSSKKDQQPQLMFPFFVGAAAASLIMAAFFAKGVRLYTTTEWIVFVYLGAVASGVGFFMWNRGALRVTTPTLTAANNLKLPIAMIVSIVFFGEQANLLPLTFGLILILLGLRFAQKA
jgi:drug/metabolite transporter (DMT)-like permease